MRDGDSRAHPKIRRLVLPFALEPRRKTKIVEHIGVLFQRHVVGIVQHHHWLEERFDSPLHALVHALQVRGLRANG